MTDSSESQSSRMGRPTEYNPEIVQAARDYLVDYKEKHGHSIPSVVGLCKIISRGKSTIYDWANSEHASYHEEFSDIVAQINEYQEFDLVDGGLTNEFNPTIAKLLLHKHGHSDKAETKVEANVSLSELTETELKQRAKQLFDAAKLAPG